jgi:hypothetical protein
VASNALWSGARGQYTAGKSVTLQPGFVAQAGSVFTATIATVVSSSLGNDVPGLSIRADPNPFIDQTIVEYSLPLGGRVCHTLLDAKGQVLQQSEDLKEQAVGTHQSKVWGIIYQLVSTSTECRWESKVVRCGWSRSPNKGNYQRVSLAVTGRAY